MRSLLQVKAELLAGAYITISDQLLSQKSEFIENQKDFIELDNLYHFPNIFFKLNKNIRVRSIVNQNDAPFRLTCSENNQTYDILYTCSGDPLITNIEIEQIQVHAPEQVFFTLFDSCIMDCKFCPLPLQKRDGISYDAAAMIKKIKEIGIDKVISVGITSGIPSHSSSIKMAEEMAKTVETLREEFGTKIVIGVSVLIPGREILRLLRDSGADEIRLNLEVYNENLARVLTPHKKPGKVLESVAEAVNLFGRGKVSSNMILGIGEEDEDVIRGIEHLAQLGAVATLYPFDFVPERDSILQLLTAGKVKRPPAERLLHLAYHHKELLSKYDLDPRNLKTMCPACSASFIMPFVDF